MEQRTMEACGLGKMRLATGEDRMVRREERTRVQGPRCKEKGPKQEVGGLIRERKKEREGGCKEGGGRNRKTLGKTRGNPRV